MAQKATKHVALGMQRSVATILHCASNWTLLVDLQSSQHGNKLYIEYKIQNITKF